MFGSCLHRDLHSVGAVVVSLAWRGVPRRQDSQESEGVHGALGPPLSWGEGHYSNTVKTSGCDGKCDGHRKCER